MAVGRISGPLLKDNLLRNGVNLAFETSLLYLDVNNSRIGINTATPQYTLDVNGATNTANLNVITQALIGTGGNQFTVSGNTIASSNQTINLTPQGANPVVYQGRITVGNFNIAGNTISNTGSNDDINVTALGTGKIRLNNNTLITGNLHATGVITADGNITLGDNVTQDTITFSAEVSSDILPKTNNLYNLGSASSTWASLYVNTISATNLITTDLTATGTLSVAGLSTLSGDVTIGDTDADTVTVNASINSNLVPLTTATYDIGTSSLYWNNVYANTFTTSGLTINSNTVTATGTDSNLVLTANGTGTVSVPNNTLAVTNNATIGGTLDVTGASTLAAVGITGTLTQTGDFDQTGNFSSTGTVTVTGDITGTGTLTLPAVTISGSVISGTATNTDLQITANGTGKILVPSNDVQITQNLSVGGTLDVTGASTLAALGITGTLTQTGDFDQTGGDFTTTGTIESAAITSTGTLTLPNLSFSGSTITGIVTNTDLILTPYSGKIVNITSSTTIDQNLSVTGTLDVTGASTLAEVAITGTLTQTGNFDQTSGNFTTTGTIDSGAITSSGTLTLPDISISGSTITGTSSSDLTLTPKAGQIVKVTGSATIDENLSVGSTLDVTNDATLTDVGITGTLTQTGNFTQTGDFSSTGDLTVTGNILGTGTLTLPAVTIDSGTISGTATDTDLTLTANGIGKILVPSNDVQIDQNLSVDGDFAVTGISTLGSVDVTGNITQTGDFVQTGDFSSTGDLNITGDVTVSGTVTVPNITIGGNTISTNSGDLDLNLTGNGTGVVNVEQLSFSDSTVSSIGSNADIYLEPQATGGVVINNTGALTIPVGSSGQQPAIPTDGMIRYNTTKSRYEGYSDGYWQNLAGVESYDGKTRITTESAPGAGDNVIRFYANNVNTAYIDSDKFYTNGFQTSALDISNSTISGIGANTDVNFTTSGTGGVVLGNLKFAGNTITNTANNAITTFTETGTGYVKIAGTYGVVIPVGSDSNYPATPETGMMRLNTDRQYVEIYNSGNWTSIAGTTTSLASITDLVLGIVISLG